MGKTILLIESDAAFAREMSAALEARGFAVRVSGDGKEGLDVARDLMPDALVLCVELPRMSGYSVCNKLKKDDALKSIPLVIISAEATPETFEQHRKLKTRAEDYLIKPFPPETLVEHIGSLVGFPTPVAGDEEVVTLADVELEPANAEAPALDLAARPEEDEDLRLLDDAFDNIARVDAAAPLLAVPEAASPPPAEAHLEVAPLATADVSSADEAPALADEARGDGEPLAAEALLIPATEPALSSPPPEALPAGADLLRAAGIPMLEPVPAEAMRHELLEEGAVEQKLEGQRRELAEARRGLEERDAGLQALREELSLAQGAAEQAAHEISARESELRATRARLEAVQGSVKRLEADLKASRDEGRRAQERLASLEKELAALRPRTEEAEHLASQRGNEVADALARAESLERSLDESRAETAVTRSEADALRGEAERRTGDLRKRILELESQTARHEERVVKAYQKIKNDEKLKEKTRKALAVALQLLDERLPVEGGGEPPVGPERPAS